MKLHKQKHGHRMHKFMTWLLILGMVFSVFAGSSLSVSAQDSVFDELYFKASRYVVNGDNKNSYHWDGTFSFPVALFLVGYSDSYDSAFKPARVPSYAFCYYTSKNASNATNARLYFSGSYEWFKNGQLLSSSSSYSDFWASPFPAMDVTHQAGYLFYSLDTDIPVFDDTEKLLTYLQTGDDSGRLNLSSPGPDEGDDEEDAWYKELIGKIKDWIGGMFEILVRPLELLADGITSVRDSMLDKLPLKIKNVLFTLFHAQELLAEYTFGKISDLYDFQLGKAQEFLTFLLDIKTALTGLAAEVYSHLPQGIKDVLEPFLIGFDTALGKLNNGIDHLGDKFTDWLPTFNEIRDQLKNSRLKDIADDMKKILSYFSGDFSLSDFIGTFWEKYKEYSNPLDFFAAWTKETFKHTIFYTLFVPSDEFLDEMWEDVHTRFSGIFAIMGYVKKVIDFLMTCSGKEAPSFTVNLGKSASYYLGDSTVTIDFSWYEPYKPTVDLLFSAIIWAGFLWRMYSRIPEIIGGVGMAVSLPYRLEHYEVENERKSIARSRSDIRWEAWVERNGRRRR